MTAITHKQARSYLRAATDGLLREEQRALLDAHLLECDSCRTEADELNALETRLKENLQAKWDAYDGPSRNVMTNIHSRSRRIIMTNQISTGLRTVAGVAALIILGLVANFAISQLKNNSIAATGVQNVGSGNSANNVVEEELTPVPAPQTNSLIAFTSEKDGNLDIYSMHADGSSVTNLTNNPAEDTNPVWSPDGRHIAFVSNRDGNENIYVMNFDGSNLTRLTDDAAQDTNPVWSPDGAKIAYASGDFSKLNTNIFVMDSSGQNQRQLTHYVPNTTVWPQVWSPDSQFILFEVYRQIVQVGLNDGMVTPLTPQTDVYVPYNFLLSADGSRLIYITEGCDQNERGSNEFCNLVKTGDRYGSNEETKSVLQIASICGVGANLTWTGSLTRWSPDQTRVLMAFTCGDENNGWLYIANADGSDFKRLTNYPVFSNLADNEVAMFEWSPDSQSIIFASPRDNAGHDELYTLDIQDVLRDPNLRPTPLNSSATKISAFAWQPISKDQLAKEKSTPVPSSQPEGLLAFTSKQDGDAEIYTIRTDGTGLTNLTNNPARDANPVWSPDGKRIAFESDRDGGNPSQIFLMDADGSNTTPLTTDDGDHMLPSTTNSKTNLWSPDGNQLLYMRIGRSDTEWTLQSIDLNTGDITSLGTGKVDINHISWSPDGKHIAFIHNDPANTDDKKYIPQMQIVCADGTNLTTITMPSEEGLNVPINYYWSGDGQSVFLITSNMYAENTASENYTWKVYEANLDGTLTLQTTTHSPIGGWWNGTYFLAGSALGSSSPAFTWVQQKGKMTSVNPLRNCQELLDSNTSSYASGRSSYKQSANGNLVIGGYCPNGDMWLFWANSKGTVRQLLNLQSVAAPDTTGALAWAPNDFAWSPDDKYIAFSISSPGKTDLYIVNVTESLKDPSIQPVRMTIGDGSLYYSPSWHSFVP